MLREVEARGTSSESFIIPDMSKFKKAKTDEIATAVGQAADVLTDGEPRSW